MKYDLTKKPTRSSVRTLKAFTQAMFSLCAEKPFDAISVSELCDRAGYPRATFYNYFDDKYDLLEYCWHTLAQEVRFDDFRDMDSHEVSFVFFDRMCNLLDDRKKNGLLEGIIRMNPKSSYFMFSFSRFVEARAMEVVQESVCEVSHIVNGALLARHCSNTLVMMLEWLYMDESKHTREEAFDALKAFLLPLAE